jgi:Mg/Co/Ni transporter MgtE
VGRVTYVYARGVARLGGAQAGGNFALALMLTVICSTLGVFSVPVMLDKVRVQCPSAALALALAVLCVCALAYTIAY